MILEALLYELRKDTTVKRLVGQRIYPMLAPQNVQKPYIVLVTVSAPREHSHDGASRMVKASFQISCFADTLYKAKQVARSVQLLLQGFSGYMGSPEQSPTVIGAIFYEDERDSYEVNTKLFHVAGDYRIIYTE